MSGIDSFTKILLHFDGSDAGTTITDSSLSPKTFTAQGDGQLDTAVKKFGTAALLCDGNGDYVDTPDHIDFTLGSGDWTADCWFLSNSSTNRFLFGQGNSSGSNDSTSIFAQYRGSDIMICGACSGGDKGEIEGTIPLVEGVWTHLAFVRTGNTLKMFIDGVEDGSIVFTLPVNDSANAFAVGRRGERTQEPFLGSIDEFRLSVGVARWTTNFTPPASAYSIDAPITGALFENVNTFFAASLTYPKAVSGILFSNVATFFAAAVAIGFRITAALVTNTSTFFAATVDQDVHIGGVLFSNTNTFFGSTVARVATASTDIRDLYVRTSAQKKAFWSAVAADRIRRGM